MPKIESQRVRLGGRWYVIVPEPAFERLCAAASKVGRSELVPPAHAGDLSPLSVDDASLAPRLIERRRRVGLSQAALARRAGIRVETLNRIERGKTVPDFSTIRKLVVAMNAVSRRV